MNAPVSFRSSRALSRFAGFVLIFAVSSAQAAQFVRGDVDGVSGRNITDPIRILGYLFLGSPAALECIDAADADDSGALNITDAVFLLSFLFRGGAPPPPPFPACGDDPTADALGCDSSPACAGGGEPVLTEVHSPEMLPFGAAAEVTFRASDADADITTVLRTFADELGRQLTEPVPAKLLNVDGPGGAGSFVVRARDLAFGENTLTLQLRDAAGNLSEAVSVRIVVAASSTGGSAPVVEAFEPLVGAWTKPAAVSYGPGGRGVTAKLAPRFRLAYSDPDGDIVRLRGRVVDPDGLITINELDARSLAIRGAAGERELNLLDLRADSPPGIYEVDATLIDAAGNRSATVSAALELGESGAPPPTIAGFDPPGGSEGEEIVIDGAGFSPALDGNQVTLAQVSAELIDATSTRLKVLVPAGAGTGKLVVRTPDGVAVSPAFFLVPALVTVEPADVKVVVGGAVRMEARVVSSFDSRVIWSVNGVVGGDGAHGTIGEDGLYTAPRDLPANGSVVVRAALTANPSVAGEALLSILPPPPTAGRGAVLASTGGTVPSAGGIAAISISAGALASDAEITIRELFGRDLPASSPGTQVLGAVVLGPPGTTFLAPVTVTVPLARFMVPGTRLPLSFLAADGSLDAGEGIFATVLENGDRAEAPIHHFSTAVVTALEPVGPADPPEIHSISPSEAEEGERAPVLIEGANLAADLRVEILRDGAWTRDIEPGALFVNGVRAGVLLSVRTIEDLPAGQSRRYSLRLVRGNAGLAAEIPFTVHGLDELIVGSGRTRIDIESAEEAATRTRRYSEIRVESGAVLESLPEIFRLESRGPVVAIGPILASGKNGASGDGQSPGDDPDIGVSRGGRGRDDHGCFIVAWEDYDCAEDENWGEDAPRCIGNNEDNPRAAGPCLEPSNHPRGLGGRPGNNRGNFVIGDIVSAIECVVATNVVCALQLANNIFELVDAHVNEDGTIGGAGFGGLGHPGHSPEAGGGGGGGGKVDGVEGGGGGQGGQRGRSLAILTSDRIVIASRLASAGGDGGDGGVTEEGIVDQIVDVAMIFGNGNPVEIAGRAVSRVKLTNYTNAGGGGGGGSGGGLRLTAGLGILADAGSEVTARGGRGGAGGVRIFDEQNTELFHFTYRFAHGGQGAAGDVFLADPFDDLRIAEPLFVPTTIDTMVSDRTLFPGVAVHGSRLVSLSPKRYVSIVVSAHNEASGTTTHVTVPGDTATERMDFLLEEGLNVFTAAFGDPPDPGDPPVSMHELLAKRVLVVAVDSDADGLGDRDEAALGTNPADPDTDHDGLSDSNEVLRGSNPIDADTDGDGLDDGDEAARGTRLDLADTDADGVQDGAEVYLGSNPVDPSSRPAQIPPGALLAAASLPADGARLAIIDVATGTLGVLGRPDDGRPFGLAFDAAGRLLVALGARLAVHDPFTGASADIGPFETAAGDSVSVIQIAFGPVDRNLYGIEAGPPPDFAATGQLLRVEPATARCERIGAPAASPYRALAFDETGRLLACSGGETLLELDASTGATIGTIGSIALSPLLGLAFDRAGALHGAQSLSPAGSRLLSVSPVDGATVAGPMLGREVSALASAPCQAPCLGAPASIGVPDPARPVALADLDLDGLLDVAVGTSQPSVAVLPGNGDGTFQPGRRFPLPTSPDSIVIADLDADGFGDIVTGHRQDQTAGVLINDRAGGFLAASQYGMGGVALTLSNVTVGRVDGDANLDIVAGSFAGDGVHPGQGFLSMRPGNGSGAFGPLVQVANGTAGFRAVDLADLNADGAVDAVAARSFGFVLTLFYGDGAGGFPRAANAGGQGLPVATTMVVTDLDGNGRADATLNNVEGQNVAVFASDGVEGFAPPTFHALERAGGSPVNHSPAALAIGDLSGDGTLDIGVANNRSGTLSVLLGEARFDSQLRPPYAAGAGAAGLAIGDLDGDGLLDLVVVVTGRGVAGVYALLNQKSF